MRHPTQTPTAPVLAVAVDEAIRDGLSVYYLVGFLTGAVRSGWTEQETAHQLTGNAAAMLARMQVPPMTAVLVVGGLWALSSVLSAVVASLAIKGYRR